ncbi:MAG: PKD domain-containing protein, partial [Bacteroidota bacterium]
NQCLVGNNFIFSDTSSILAGTITRLWSFGNGDTSTAINPTKSYSSANSYAVKLLETSDNGCVDSITKIVIVNPKPTVGFSINNTLQCVNGNNFIFTDTSSILTGTINRQWNFGTGISDTSTANNPNKFYTSANTYAVKLFVNSNYGCKDSVTKTVTVNPKPNVGFTINNTSQCVNGNSFLFNDTSSIGSGTVTRNWDFGNGTNSSNINPSLTYSNANSYQVKVVSLSNNGCKDSVTKTVTVNPKPSVGFIQNLLSQCLSGNNFVLNDTSTISSGTINRVWNFGDATTSSSLNPNKNYSSAGTYQVKLVATSNNNCKDSLSKNVSVYTQPKSGFTISNISQCLIGNSFLFDDTTSTTATRLWDLGDLSTNSNDTFSKTYSNVGTYNVKLKVNDAHSCSDSITKVVIVKPSPAKPMVSAITKSLLQSTVDNSYQWYLNNSIISSANNQTLAITTNGNYSVLIDSTNGCSNLSNPFAASSVGVAGINISQNEIKIYPNPAKDELHIETSGNEKFGVQLFDMTGKEVSGNISFINSAIINTQSLSEGIYFVRITDVKGIVFIVQKVVLVR